MHDILPWLVALGPFALAIPNLITLMLVIIGRSDTKQLIHNTNGIQSRLDTANLEVGKAAGRDEMRAENAATAASVAEGVAIGAAQEKESKP